MGDDRRAGARRAGGGDAGRGRRAGQGCRRGGGPREGGGALGRHAAELAAAGVAGLVGVVVLAWLFLRRPALLGFLAVLALPFRVPVPLGAETASLLVPLYGVVAAGVVAEAVRRLRP